MVSNKDGEAGQLSLGILKELGKQRVIEHLRGPSISGLAGQVVWRRRKRARDSFRLSTLNKKNWKTIHRLLSPPLVPPPFHLSVKCLSA